MSREPEGKLRGRLGLAGIRVTAQCRLSWLAARHSRLAHRFLSTSTPGRALPSSHSRNAPPAVETYENCCATLAWLSAATVSPPPATDNSLPARVRAATCFAAATVPWSK